MHYKICGCGGGLSVCGAVGGKAGRQAGGIEADEKLVTEIVKVNLKFGIFHTMDMLNDGAGLLAKCVDKREKALVSEFLALWEERSGI